VGVSGEIKEAFIRQYRFKEDRISVIHNGIEIPELLGTRENSEYFVIGSSGRLFPVKDYAFMIEIARTVLKKTNRARFQLAGDGPEKIKLKALASRYHLDNVFAFKGHIQDISPFYQGLDLYLNTSVNEGIPLSVLEAMAHKLPVIAPRVGGLPEIVDDGVQGYLLEERNPKAFAEKCLFLYENKFLRQRMSEAAREKVEQRFSMEQMARDYFNLYVALAQDR
jgi:glycosyltransferase involved in cell wall biosynthesis